MSILLGKQTTVSLVRAANSPRVLDARAPVVSRRIPAAAMAGVMPVEGEEAYPTGEAGYEEEVEEAALPRATMFLQQAETVRLATPCAAAVSLPVTRAAAGARLLVRPSELGTHVGQTIKAKVREL